MFGIDALHNFSVHAMVDWVQAAGLKAGTSCNARRTDLADISQQCLAGIDFGDSIAVCINVELHKYGVRHPRYAQVGAHWARDMYVGRRIGCGRER